MSARLAIVVNLVLASAVYADGATEPPLDVFLEQRVAEELAADGTLLSRLGVTLDIQIVENTTIVSLLDATTRRAVASTTLERTSSDREGAVASVKAVAADLATQIMHGAPRSPALQEARRDDLAAREYRYRQDEITFDTSLESWGRMFNKRAPYRGTLRDRLGEEEFFTTVDRPDLADAYRTRRRGGLVALIGGSLLYLGGGALLLANEVRQLRGDGQDYFWNASPIGFFGAIAGAVLGGTGGYFLTNPLPVDDRELYQLARTHNRKLRVKNGLPVTVAPYAQTGGGGVMVGGTL